VYCNLEIFWVLIHRPAVTSLPPGDDGNSGVFNVVFLGTCEGGG